MKKMTTLLLAVIMMLTTAVAFAENPAAAPEDVSAQTGVNVTLNTAALTSDEYLDKVMADAYLTAPADDAAAGQMALELAGLSAVTTKDIAVYAAAKQLPAAQVRNKYFRSLANVLRAEIAVNPAAEEEYKNIQTVLSLFLDENDDNLSQTSREAVRSTITSAQASAIADGYNLPQSFVEFIVMDDNWDDDDWKNDNAWQAAAGYNTDDLYADSLENYIDTDGVIGNSNDGTVDYPSADYNTPDYNTPEKNTPDYNTPEKNTPDYKTPDYNTPDYKTPDYNTPDYKTPDYNTPDYKTPDYNTPEYNSPASPDYNSGGGSGGSYDS